MSDNIPPYEVQLEIIKKVSDVKCLIRMRSVSKQWMSFIDSREFIEFYGVPRRHTRLLLRYKENPYKFNYVSFIDDDDDDGVTFPQQRQDFASNLPNLMKEPNDLNVIGSSCGLWCLHTYGFFVIWNPAICKLVGINIAYLGDNHSTFGFGVCPKTYDPTIVEISPSHEVWIYSLSSNKVIPCSKVFRESIRLKATIQSLRLRKPSRQVAVGRFIYWIAFDADVNLILSFDLITHEFKEVDLPVSVANKASQNISISELNGSLVVAAYTNEVNDGKAFGVWMMEGGAMTSFTKLFNIKTPDYSFRRTLLGFRKNGEPIIETSEDEKLAALEVYEPCSETINDLGIKGEFGSFSIFPYIETLLLIDR